MTRTAALRQLLAPVRRRLAASLALAAAGAASGVLGLLAAAGVVSTLLSSAPDRGQVAGLCGLTLAGALGQFWLRSAAIRVSHLASYDIEVDVRTRLTEHLARIGLGPVADLGSGAIKKIVQDDVRSLHGAAGDIPPLFGFAVTGGVAATVAMAVLDWRLALVGLSLAPVAWFALRLGLRDPEQLRVAWSAANERMATATLELVQGMPVTRTFDAGRTVSERFRSAVAEFTEAMTLRGYTSRPAVVATRLFVGPLPTYLVILTLGSWLVLSGSLTVPALLAFLLVGTIAVESVGPLLWLSEDIRESGTAAMRIAEVLAIPILPEPAQPAQPLDGSVRLRDVRFGYGGGRLPALDGVDLDIPDGSVCALVGASGAGKSTVLRLIARFWDVDEGAVEVGSRDVRHIASSVLLRTVTVVFQEPFLTHDTVRENIRLARPDATDAEVVVAAQAACAHQFIVDDLPDGYNTVVGERGATLSGGQRQRVTIARALLSDARVVLLDEATAFTDPENEAAIQAAVARLCRDRTVIVVAHRLATVRDADQIVVMAQGRVDECGTHDSLLAAPGVYSRMWADSERAAGWALGGAS